MLEWLVSLRGNVSFVKPVACIMMRKSLGIISYHRSWRLPPPQSKFAILPSSPMSVFEALSPNSFFLSVSVLLLEVDLKIQKSNLAGSRIYRLVVGHGVLKLLGKKGMESPSGTKPSSSRKRSDRTRQMEIVFLHAKSKARPIDAVNEVSTQIKLLLKNRGSSKIEEDCGE